MAVPNCNFNDNKKPGTVQNFYMKFNRKINQDITYLNTLKSNDSDFHPIKCGNKICYTSTDPRLIDQNKSGTTLILDKPPLDTSYILLKDIYT